MLIIDRATRCILGWAIIPERTFEAMQALLDRSPQATWYYSDYFSTYHALVYYPGHHRALKDKSQTFTVEGVNADLRHYMAPFRRASRCFARSLENLQAMMKVFTYWFNRCQLRRREYPSYPVFPSTLVSFYV